MGMTIEQIIKYIPAPICGSTVIGKEKQKEYDAHDSAIIILRKYQKIEQIVNNAKDSDGAVKYNWFYEQIRKVVEDGRN